jgi:hypothetical protein
MKIMVVVSEKKIKKKKFFTLNACVGGWEDTGGGETCGCGVVVGGGGGGDGVDVGSGTDDGGSGSFSFFFKSSDKRLPLPAIIFSLNRGLN